MTIKAIPSIATIDLEGDIDIPVQLFAQASTAGCRLSFCIQGLL
jgi:hypothetical protein